MADLPDYYTQAQISEAEAASVKGGLDANKSATPVSRDLYLATDTIKLYYCVVDGAWLDITHACLLLTGGTMSGNIVMGGNKITGLGAPAAQDDALRYNRLEIRNAEIAAAAGIVVSKLVNTYFPETLMTAQGDLLIRGAANPERLAKIATGQFLRATATGYEGAPIASPLTVAETEVFSGAAPTSWTDLDLSGTIGAQSTLVLIKIATTADTYDLGAVAVRKNGDADEFYSATADADAGGCALARILTAMHNVLLVVTDATGKIEWCCANARNPTTVDIIAYIK